MYSKLVFFCSCLLLIACNKDEKPVSNIDNFDRTKMLNFWADNIIIPSLENYNIDLKEFDNKTQEFFNSPSVESYDKLVSAWLESYNSWQSVSMFNIGKAEELGLINFTNIYPTDTTLINSNIEFSSYNLTLPSNYDAQGFPALDYLLFGITDSKSAIIEILKEEKNENYFKELVSRLSSLTEEVLLDWNTDFRQTFVDNNGSSATASVDKMVNDFLFYYEKFFRAGKVGIPAGVFSGSKISGSVEAPYSGIYSKQLCESGFEAVMKFFVGQSFDGSVNGISLEDYLKYIMDQNNTTDISQRVLSQWSLAEDKLMVLNDNFKFQVDSDNAKMLEFYDELQKAVIILKVEMMQAINIQVDFVDADGD